MNCPDNDLADCEEYRILREQHEALIPLFAEARGACRFRMCDVILGRIQEVVNRRAEHFDKHVQARMARR